MESADLMLVDCCVGCRGSFLWEFFLFFLFCFYLVLGFFSFFCLVVLCYLFLLWWFFAVIGKFLFPWVVLVCCACGTGYIVFLMFCIRL